MPFSLTASPCNTVAFLEWEAVPGAATYEVYQDGVSIAAGVTGTSLDVDSLTNGTEYAFYVEAYDAVPALRDTSTTVTVTPESGKTYGYASLLGGSIATSPTPSQGKALDMLLMGS